MIGTGEGDGVASIGPAQPIAPMAADVEEGVDGALAVAYHQDRVLAHRRAEEVPRLGDLAFMAQKQPAAGKDLHQLLLIDRRLDEDAPADQPLLGVHQLLGVHCHHPPPDASLGVSPRSPHGPPHPPPPACTSNAGDALVRADAAGAMRHGAPRACPWALYRCTSVSPCVWRTSSSRWRIRSPGWSE